jgi:hypothetical protein
MHTGMNLAMLQAFEPNGSTIVLELWPVSTVYHGAYALITDQLVKRAVNPACT